MTSFVIDNVTYANTASFLEEMTYHEKEGATFRRTGSANPHVPGTWQFHAHINGWVREDLRLTLCKSDAFYRREQELNGMMVDDPNVGAVQEYHHKRRTVAHGND